MRIARRTVLAALVLPALWHSRVQADGCYIPEKAIVKLPEIPAQRAVVSYRDGEEVLIVESALKGRGRRFGWIVPVPSRPEKIEACSPGTLQSAAMGIQPEILHDFGRRYHPVYWGCGCLLVLFMVWCGMKRSGAPKKTRVWGLLGTAFLLFVVFCLGVPSLLAARRGSLELSAAGLPEGLTVLERARVGSYQVAVVAAEGAEALYAWLASEELAVPEALRPAVEDYAERGWRFVTAKLITDGKGSALPHPLRIAFRTERAVYPMRLTALSGSDLDLELYVVGGKAASAPGMERVHCERFREGGDTALFRALMYAVRHVSGPEPCFAGSESDLTLGHPGLTPVLWDGCWVSKLTGRLSPAAMGEDFYLSWSDPAYERRTFYSGRGAWTIAHLVGALSITLSACLALVIWAYYRLSNAGLLWVLAAAVCATAVAAFLVKSSLPQVEVTAYGGKLGKTRYQLWAMRDYLESLDEKLADGKLAPAEAAARLRGKTAGWRNVYTGGPLREADSPGNCLLAVEKDTVSFTLHDLGGTPVRLRLGGRRDD